LILPKVRRNPLVEIIPINSGCLNHCTYCKTKHARGALASYSIGTRPLPRSPLWMECIYLIFSFSSKPLTLDLTETLDLLFRRTCFYQNASYRKMNGIKVVDKLSIYKVGSVHFWHRIHPKKLRILQQMLQNFHEVQSLRLLR
jgi:hypothetical protein